MLDPRAIAAAAMAVVLGGCLQAPAYQCQTDEVCVLNDVRGRCDLSTQSCVYMTPACPSGWRDGMGSCVDGTGVASASASGASSTTMPEPDTTSSGDAQTSSSTTSAVSASSTGSTGRDPSESSSSSGSGEPCDGITENITALGVVGASTVFTGYPPGLSVDGELATSWFSTGPEPGNVPSIYTWTLGEPHCVSRLFISGNGLNQNPDFREGYGFDRVVFRIFDGAAEVFQAERDLPGSPDPDVSVDVPGIDATRITLEFHGHESDDCGGFSELQVLGN